MAVIDHPCRISIFAVLSTTECIAVTSYWARRRLNSPASRWLAQKFIQAQIKGNTKAPRHWPLCGEFTGDRWIPRTKASDTENVSIWWRHHGVTHTYRCMTRQCAPGSSCPCPFLRGTRPWQLPAVRPTYTSSYTHPQCHCTCWIHLHIGEYLPCTHSHLGKGEWKLWTHSHVLVSYGKIDPSATDQYYAYWGPDTLQHHYGLLYKRSLPKFS